MVCKSGVFFGLVWLSLVLIIFFSLEVQREKVIQSV